MRQCSAELIKAILITGAGVMGVGTDINLTGLFTNGIVELFDEITVFNDSDRPIRVAYTNTLSGKSDFFIVPHGGKSFTHVLNTGSIATASLKVYSIDATLATGNITINLSKNHL